MPGMPGMPGGQRSGGPQGSGQVGPQIGTALPPGLMASQPQKATNSNKQSDFASSGASAAAAAAAAAAGPGKSQGQFEIPQAKVNLVIGKQGSTINAIKAYSKAQLFVEQHVPDDEKARITVVGTDTEIAKCKQTVLALVDGTMSLPTLFQLAGLPMPAGAKEHAEESSRAQPPPPRGGPPPPTMAPLPFPGGPPGMPPMPMMAGGVSGVPGMPENQQMQQNLNDYYARMWSQYGKPQQTEAQQAQQRRDDVQAFDKEALARLAEQAAKAALAPKETEPPTPPPPPSPHTHMHSSSENYPPVMPPPPQSAPSPPSMAAPGSPDNQAGLAERASMEVRALLGNSGTSSPNAGAAVVAPPSSLSTPYTMPSAGPALPGLGLQPQPKKMQEFTLKGFLRPEQPQKPKKDDDSVQKMLERLQGNVQQTKQAVAFEPPMQQQRMMPNRPGQVFSPEAGMQFAPAGRQDERTRADFEFQALVSRMLAAQSNEEVEHVGREVLIRFPSFSPQQATELLQKVGSADGLQQDDFLAELSRLIIPRLKEFTSAQFTALTSTLASWSADARGDRRKRGGRFPELSRAFFSAASTEMSSRLMEFAPHEINCCLAAFVSVGFSEHKFFASVGRAALARHSSFAPVQLTALLAILSEMRLVHVDLFNAAAVFLATRSKELRPVDIIRVLRSYSKCSVQNQGLCKAMGDEVVYRVREQGYNTAFKAEDLCEIAWALCVLQHYHEALFRTMFKNLEKVPMISTDALIMVYESHLVLQSEYKEAYSRYAIDPDVEQALLDHYKDNRKDERRCSERQRNDVASVLKSLVDGSVHVNHRTSTGLLVDVAALRKRSSTDGFIHVDLDSAITVVRSLDQDEVTNSSLIIEGPVALRRNLLAKAGLRLITVRESEWRALDDSKDKRRYLRSLLSNLGLDLK
mmetsp:Transcript_57395/g.124176  ORF Transcript_57395/g.124176 Transcript_57395/m.124176 type:complete len:919 (-) Transcript_57395:104-2860(-)